MDKIVEKLPSIETSQVLSDEMMSEIENGDGCSKSCSESCKKSCQKSDRGDTTTSGTISLPTSLSSFTDRTVSPSF